MDHKSEFKILPVKLTAETQFFHTLYYKIHEEKHPNLESGAKETTPKKSNKTLFVTNLPRDVEEETLKSIFSVFGAVEKVTFLTYTKLSKKKDSSSKIELISAHVTFTEQASVNRALRKSSGLIEKSSNMSLFQEEELFGVNRWIKEHSETVLDKARLKTQVNTFMKNFDLEKEMEDEKLEQEMNQVDEDGFIKVIKKGKKKNTDGSIHVSGFKASPLPVSPFALPPHQQAGSTVRAGAVEDKKKKKEKILHDFYKFQKAEAKQQQLEQLRQKFEEDKKRIERLKNNRKFKPY